MEDGKSGTDDSEDLSRRKKMEGLSLHFATPQSTDIPNSTAFIDTNNISFPFTFTGPLNFSLDDFSILKEDKDNIINKSNSHLSKMTENTYTDSKGDLKPFDRSDLSDIKGMSPLQILAVSAFQEMGQPSPASSTSQAGPQVLRYQTSGGAGDAMLSAINYNNESEILNESAFDMNTTNSTQLDEGIMGNPSQNIRLSEGQGTHTYDLFDGNVNETLSLSPQPFAESGFSVGDNGNISSGATDSDGHGTSVLNDQQLSTESPTEVKKGKNRPPKTLISPLKQNIQCPTCGKGFTNSSALAKHRLTHSEERKYICNVCSKGFKRQDHLNGHLMTHREKKPYECQVENCEKSYCDARSLRRHLETHHRQSPEAIAASVLASMAAAGITNQNQPNGKPRAADQRAFQEATQILQMGSPSYSANTTPSPSPGFSNTQQHGKPFFQFEQQPTPTVPAQTPPKNPTPVTSKQNWQERNQIYNFVSNPYTQPSPNPHEAHSSSGYSPVSPVPPNSQPTSPLLAQHQRQLWFNNSTPADISKPSEEVVKPQVTCSICQKKFKNIPALNGHMRLHGGYMKKEKDKDENKKSSTKKNRTMKPPPPRPVSVQNPNPNTISQMSNMLPSLNQSLQLMSPQYTTAGQSVAPSQGVHPTNVQQPPSISEPTTFLRQQHPILQQQLQIQSLQQTSEQQQQQQNMSLLENIKPSLQQLTSAAPNSVSDVVHNQLATFQQPALLQQVIQGEQFLHLHQLDPLQQQLIQQQLQQLTVQSISPHLLQQQTVLSQLTAQQLETLQQLQQLQPSQIQQLIQEHHLQQQQQEQNEQRVKSEPQSDPTQSSLQETAQVHILSPVQVSQAETERQPILQMNQQASNQQFQQLANQMKLPITLETNAGSPSVLRSHLEQTLNIQGDNFPPGLELDQQSDVQGIDLTRHDLHNQHQQQAGGELENLELRHISQTLLNLQSQPLTMTQASSIQSSMGNPFNQRPDPASSVESLDSGSSPYISGSDVHLSQSSQNQDVMVAHHFLGNLPEVIHLSSQTNVEPSSQQEEKLSNIQPTLHPFSFVSHSLEGTSSSLNTIDSIRRELMASQPKPVPNVLNLSVSSSDHDEILQSQNFRPISSSHSEVRRRLSADSERTISPQHTHNSHSSLTMLLTKGDRSETFVKPKGHAEFSPPSGRVRMRSKSGDEHIRSKLMRSKSVDHSVMRPRSRTEESLLRARQLDEKHNSRLKSHNSEDMLSKSDGAGVFRNPGLLTSPIKFKRKHRPAPLFIPPHLNSFQSRLRSPRLWDGSELKGPGHGHTPPPYTPPPMLSPIRRSSGLFCSIHSSRPFSPRSAPVTPRPISQNNNLKPVIEEEIDDVEPEEETPPPETDIQPHVNIGSQYQAVLPPFNHNRKDAQRSISREDVLWEPFAMGDNSDEDVQYFQDFACSAAVNGNGSNVEYALHILYMAKGNIQKAILMIMEEPPKLPSYHTLLTYNYQESDSWLTEDIENFHKGLNQFDKDFCNVSRKVATKNVKQCVQFYYLWKKVCPEDYRRMRIIRRKREQEDLYNLRSRSDNPAPVNPLPTLVAVESESEGSMSDKTEEQMEVLYSIGITTSCNSTTITTTTMCSDTMNNLSDGLAGNIPILTVPSPSSSYTCDYPNCHATFSSKQALSGHRRMHSSSNSHNSTQSTSNPKPPKPRQPRTNKPRSSPGNKAIPILNDKGEEIFPCKLCDRVFSKVKSRSAHMKSHKMAENERSKSKTIEMMKIALEEKQFS